MNPRTLTSVLLLAVIGLASAPMALASNPAGTSVPTRTQINQALKLINCKADRKAFRTLAFAMRDVQDSGEAKAGWQPIATEGEADGMPPGGMMGVIAEMRLPAPVRVFGHETTRLILSRISIVAAFDDPDVARELTGTLELEGRGAEAPPGGMRVVHSAPEEHGDGIEVIALVADRIESDPSPISVAGCLYTTR